MVYLCTPSQKYEFVSWDDEIPIYYGKITFMFQTTNQLLDGHSLLNLPTTVEVSTEPTNLKSCPNKSTNWPWQIQGWTWPCIFRHGLVWGIMTWLCMSMWHKLKSNSTYNYIPRSLTRKCAPLKASLGRKAPRDLAILGSFRGIFWSWCWYILVYLATRKANKLLEQI